LRGCTHDQEAAPATGRPSPATTSLVWSWRMMAVSGPGATTMWASSACRRRRGQRRA